MSSKPPLLPAEIVARMLRVARIDGILILAVAGAFALASASMKDLPGALVGLLVAAAGATELHGVGLLHSGERRGLGWLINSQLYLLGAILVYAGWRLVSYDATPMRALITPEMRQVLQESGYSVDQFLLLVYRMVYFTVSGVAVLYQGGMALYYYRRRAAVAAMVYSAGSPPTFGL